MDYCAWGSIRDAIELTQRPLKEKEIAAVMSAAVKGLLMQCSVFLCCSTFATSQSKLLLSPFIWTRHLITTLLLSCFVIGKSLHEKCA